MQTYLTQLAAHFSGANPPANQVPVTWQYNCICAHIGGTYSEAKPPSSSTDAAVQAKVISLQATGNLPGFSASRLIVVFTKGISFANYGVSGGWCAYHNSWGANEYYALVPQPTSTALCATDDTTAWESVTSHEIQEAMTDPVVGGGWTEGGGEGGDSCNFQEVTLPFGTIQRFADNSQQTCSVWTPTFPSFWVKPFSPWPGYGMSVGYFLAGDCNRDGKTDLVHIVAGTNYANVWTSNGDGTFAVKAFAPWPGYAMDIGHFLAGDINGDGRTDLVHIVAGTNYANIWLSNGDGTFVVKPFAPWAGYAMSSGYFLAGDFNGDGKTDLVHIVAGANYANIWLSNGDGTFVVKPFAPWAGYVMSSGYFLAGDFNGDGKTDLVHIVGGTDYANVWTSNGDGTFAVKAFAPWAGYSMSAGYFLAGDFNADGKTDLAHIVAGTNYANVWTSDGNSTFTVKAFAPWAGYLMSAGYFLAGDFNGDRKTDLVHIVGGTDYANVWTSLYYGFRC